MSHTDSGYAEPSAGAQAQPASSNKTFRHRNTAQPFSNLPPNQYTPRLHSFRDTGGPSDSALESLPDLAHPSLFDDLCNQEPEVFPPTPNADLAFAGLMGGDPGSFGVGPWNLDTSRYEAMTTDTSSYPDPQLSSAQINSYFPSNEPWHAFNSGPFDNSIMPPSTVNSQPTSRHKRQRISDSGVETQTSPTSQRDSSPAPTQLSVTREKRPERYHCDLCDPPKLGGFRTINDLIRHKKGVHFVYEPGDKIWRCQIPGCNCVDKIWPRRDNFCSHLKRMHFNGDEKKAKEVIDTFEERYDPAQHALMSTMTKAEPSHGRAASKTAPSMTSPMPPPTPTSFASSSLARQKLQSSLHSQLYDMPDPYVRAVLQQMPRGSRASFTGVPGRPFNSTFRSVFRGQSDGVDPACLTLSSSKKRARPSDAVTAPPNAGSWSRQRLEMTEDDREISQYSNRMPSSDEDFVGVGFGPQLVTEPSLSPNPVLGHTIELVGEPKHGLDQLEQVFADLHPQVKEAFRQSSPATLMEFIRKMKRDEESTRPKSTHKRSVSKLPTKKKADSEKTLKCDYYVQKGDTDSSRVYCAGTFNSPSELRKHKKRHDKRFVCTFDNCYSKFGTKWEWKRHESSQHIQEDAWRCRYVCNGETCQELFDKKDDFKIHLIRHFGQADVDAIEREARACYLAKKWLGSFWCGYCPRIRTSMTEFGRAMDDERIDHIAGHILEGCKATDWVELGGKGKTKEEMQKLEEDKNTRSRLHSQSTTSPSQRYRPEEVEDEDDDDLNTNEQVEATSSSDSDSPGTLQQRVYRPSLQVFTQSRSNKSQMAPMSAPPAIHIQVADESMMEGHLPDNQNARAMRQAQQFYMAKHQAAYPQQHQQYQQHLLQMQQQNPQVLQTMPGVQYGCCQCQTIHMNDQGTCFCSHQFCEFCVIITPQQQQDFQQSNFESNDDSMFYEGI